MIEGSTEVKESLCMMGGIPPVIKFGRADAGHPDTEALSSEVGVFVRALCGASQVTLHMFIACQGLPLLSHYISADYRSHPHLLSAAIHAIKQVSCSSSLEGMSETNDGMAQVFALQSSSLPRNDFCRLFAKAGLLQPLANAFLLLSSHPGTLLNILPPRLAPYVLLIA